MKIGYVGIISSVFSEGAIFRSQLKTVGMARPGHQVLYSGTVSDNRVVFGISGIGKTNAAHAATVLIERYSPSVVINFGIGGAYPSSGLNVGDIAIAEKEIYGDEGVLLKDGFHGADLIGIPLVKTGRKNYFNEFPLNGKLMNKAVKAAQLITHHPASGGSVLLSESARARTGADASPITVKKGTFLTLSTCTGTKKRALELERRFGAVCENMEGAAIAHICHIYGIPLVEMRGISNIVGDRDLSKWNISLAAENCQKAVLLFLEALRGTSLQ